MSREIFELALAEDSVQKDLSTDLTVEFVKYRDKPLATAKKTFAIYARENGCFSGQKWLEFFAQKFKMNWDYLAKEGELFYRGGRVLSAKASVPDVFAFERMLLNGLQNLCGIATLTERMCKNIKMTFEQKNLNGELPGLYHTRKTMPGWRVQQIEAVLAGGGLLHRRDLNDRAMFKDNHKVFLQEAGLRYTDFVRWVIHEKKIVNALVEVDTADEALQMKRMGAKHLLLDNFTPVDLKKLLPRLGSEITVEVSGGINADNVADYVVEGVHRISCGALTHSVRAVDLSLDWGEQDAL